VSVKHSLRVLFRQITGSLKIAVKTPAAREALLTAAHVADSRLIQEQDAYVTATLLQNAGPVLQALQPTKDAVIRAGALLPAFRLSFITRPDTGLT
jgi:hypothetical protein